MPPAFEHGLDEFFSTIQVNGIHITAGTPPAQARSRLGAHPPAGRRSRIFRQGPRAALQPAQGRRSGSRLPQRVRQVAGRGRGAGKAAFRSGKFPDHLALQPPHGGGRFSGAPRLRHRRPAGARRPADGQPVGGRLREPPARPRKGRRGRGRARSPGASRRAARTRRGSIFPHRSRRAAAAPAATSNTPSWSPTTKRPTRRFSKRRASIPSSTSRSS